MRRNETLKPDIPSPDTHTLSRFSFSLSSRLGSVLEIENIIFQESAGKPSSFQCQVSRDRTTVDSTWIFTENSSRHYVMTTNSDSGKRSKWIKSTCTFTNEKL